MLPGQGVKDEGKLGRRSGGFFFFAVFKEPNLIGCSIILAQA